MVILMLIFLLIILILQFRLTLGFTFIMDNLVCSGFVTIYFFGKTLKKLIIFPRTNKKKDKAKKVRKVKDIKQIRVNLLILHKFFKKNLILKDFKLFVKEGTGDACHTAILYGVIWSLTGLIPKIIFTEYKVKNKEIKIEADFKQKVWKVNFDCIFSLKIVNIIFMCIELIRYYLKNRKGGDADVRSSNRRSNDYSHAKY
ncbi:MAG: DUF2953 domain-containing protein [Ruminiclostridium sp.]